MLMSAATREGVKNANPNKRPFVLTRASFLGGQRYAATWTGDNQSNWEHLGLTIPMILNLGLSGQPYSGPDIGGFSKNCTPELFARWIGFGAMLPFSRGHTHHDTNDHEPYAFGLDVEEISRAAINRRYMLLPYFYTLFREASLTGLPIARPLFFADPSDFKLRNEDRIFLIGDSLMVVVNTLQNGVPDDYNYPSNNKWVSWDIDKKNYPDLPLLKIKEGSIIPYVPVQQYIQTLVPSLNLVVVLNRNGHASGHLYEDEGEGYGYLGGNYLFTTYNAQLENNKVVVSIGLVTGNFPRPNRNVLVTVLLEDGREIIGEGAEGSNIEIKI